MPDPTSTSTRITPPVLILGIALVGLGGMIWHPEGLFNRHSDLISAHLGTQSIFHDSWQAGRRFPLWRSDVLSGQPALTNPQAIYTHPVHVLFAYFAPQHVIGLVIWIHLVVGGLGGYYAGSRLGLSTPARVLIGVSVLFSFKTLAMVYAGNLGIIVASSALPWLFAATARVLHRPSVASALVLGAAAAFGLHSGHLQLIYYAALLITIWTAWTVGRLAAGRELAQAWRIGGSAVLGATIGLGVSAYLLLPVALDIGSSTRATVGYDFFVGRTPAFGLHLLTFFNPELFGSPLDGSFVESWEYMSFVGWTIAFFACLGAAHARSNRAGLALLTGLTLSVFLSLPSPFLRLVFETVPGYAMFRLPSRMLFPSAFFVCCLAGIGLDHALSTLSTSTLRTRVAILAIGLVALEGTLWARRYLQTAAPIPPVTYGDYQHSLPAHVPARIAPLSIATPAYGSAAVFGWQLVTGYDPFSMRHYQAYMDLVQHGESLGSRPTVWTDVGQIDRYDMLAALNVLYVVSPRLVDLATSEYQLVGSFQSQPQFRFYDGVVTGPVHLYQNRRFMPRAFFVSSVVAAKDERVAVDALKQIDVRERAVVIGADGDDRSASSSSDRAAIVDAKPGSLDLATRTDERRFLVISEVWHPGWSTEIDGQPARLFQTDLALLGLWVPPGDHRISIRFSPPGLTQGLAITVFVLACAISLPFWALVRRRSRSRFER